LFNLEIPIPGPILGFLGEMSRLEVFGSVETPDGTSLRDTASFDVQTVKIGRVCFAGRGDTERTKILKNEK
jgi:hypothetical protein